MVDSVENLLEELREFGVGESLLQVLSKHLDEGRNGPELVQEAQDGRSITPVDSAEDVVEKALKALLREYSTSDRPYFLSFVGEFGPGLDENQRHGRVEITAPGYAHGPEMRYSFHESEDSKHEWLAFRDCWDMQHVTARQLRHVYERLRDEFYEHDGEPISGFDGVEELLETLDDQVS